MPRLLHVTAAILFVTFSIVPYVHCWQGWEGGAIGGGIGGLIILILDLIAIFEILNGGAGMVTKLCWILLILFFPILGVILYCCFGRASVKGYSTV